MSLSVAILISAHNNKQKVISCLENCLRQIDSLASEDKYDFCIHFMDDCSTDGTLDEVITRFPGVLAQKSYTRLYRNRSLRTLWQDASQKEHDFYIWLDARVSLKEDALSSLLENSTFLSHSAIIAGSICDDEGVLVRGGRTKKGKLCDPDPVIPIPVQTFDGNLVMVPKSAYDILGMTNSNRKEYLGDWEYGIKALKAGVPRVVAPGILGTCRDLSRVKIPVGARFSYDVKSSGLFFAIRNFFQLGFNATFIKKDK